jgi:hypothetical protein
LVDAKTTEFLKSFAGAFKAWIERQRAAHPAA